MQAQETGKKTDMGTTPKKKIPQRKCLGCSESKDKNSLIRVVRTPEGSVVLDFTGKKSGRGAYVCRSPSCLKKARKAKRIERSLGYEIPDDIFDALENELENNEHGKN